MANNQSKIRRFKLNPWKTTSRNVIKDPLQSAVVNNNSTSPSIAQINRSQEVPLASTLEIASKHRRLNRFIMGTLAKSKNILVGRSDQNNASSPVCARASVQMVEALDAASVQRVRCSPVIFGSLVFYAGLLSMIAARGTREIKSNRTRSRGMITSCGPLRPRAV